MLVIVTVGGVVSIASAGHEMKVVARTNVARPIKQIDFWTLLVNNIFPSICFPSNSIAVYTDRKLTLRYFIEIHRL